VWILFSVTFHRGSIVLHPATHAPRSYIRPCDKTMPSAPRPPPPLPPGPTPPPPRRWAPRHSFLAIPARHVASRRCACAVPPNLPRFPQAWEGNGNRFVAGSRTSLPPPTFVCSFVCVPVDWFLAVLRVAPRRPIVLSYAYFSCDCEILSSRLDFWNFFSPLLWDVNGGGYCMMATVVCCWPWSETYGWQ